MVSTDGAPTVIRLGGGCVLLRGVALVHTAHLARSAADQVSRRDAIPLTRQVRDLLTALEEEASNVSSSGVPLTEFRRSVPEATCNPDDEITSQEAARMLGCTDRWVRYRAEELGGWKRAGRWVFSRRQILEHQQETS